VLGIIGRNGAGKSTLLKLLSQVTEPTEGCIKIKGRVAPLLEVGTGFHPELTGRENIFLNASILGMSRAEIRTKFDEIVAFAEVEKFIDTPVKRYSSGMYLRLAFAVAAHLEPEILMVDEVLAVGDAEFQRKCMGKMGDVARGGRTVLFVSHNMGAVSRLCDRGLWLDGGQPVLTGPLEHVVQAYLSTNAHTDGERTWPDDSTAPGNTKARLSAVRTLNSVGEPTGVIDIRHPFSVEVEYDVLEPVSVLRVSIELQASDGTTAFYSTDTADHAWHGKVRRPGRYKSCCEIPGNFLNDMRYSVSVSSDIPCVEVLYTEDTVLTFSVEQTGGPSSHYPERWPGVVCPALPWRVEMLGALQETRAPA
jgi:lipopolysaccharide transport system ATP-binding protein